MAVTGNNITEYETLNTISVRMLVKALTVLGEYSTGANLAGLDPRECEMIRVQLMEKLVQSKSVNIRYFVERRTVVQ